VVVANKLDLAEAREALPRFVAAMRKRGYEVLPISGATGEGVPAVLDACAKVLFSKTPPKPAVRSRGPKVLPTRAKVEAPRVSARKKVPSRLKAKAQLKKGARGRKR
jgi:GTP-binding protein